jgi:hypothetical protein
MRTFLTASITALTLALLASAASAAPANQVTAHKMATPLVRPVQYGGGGEEHRHHYCQPYWHWACHYGECRCYRD